MIQKRSRLLIADNTGAKIISVIEILRGSHHHYGTLGDVIVASVKEAEPGKEVKKKDVVKAVIVRERKPFGRKDGSYISFDENAAVLVDGLNPRGNRIFGPIPRELKEKGFGGIVSLAKYVV